MEEKNEHQLVKGDKEKARLKRAAELKALANNLKPKQFELFFSDGKGKFLIKKKITMKTIYFKGVIFLLKKHIFLGGGGYFFLVRIGAGIEHD